MLNSADIKRIAAEVGFDACGIARADALTDEEYPLRTWLARGWHAELQYMERNVEKRMDPRLLVEGARSVICVVSAYGPPDPDRTDGVAAYAQRREYHEVMKPMLQELKARLGIDGKVCCDTVPISDKHWAARAGLGWIGRHTLLVTPQWGSWVNLGEIVTTEECSEYSEHSEYSDFCSKCGRCVAACPNQALAPLKQSSNQAIKQSYMLNLNRCTAYYTTHHQRPMPSDLDAHGYTCGCDLCQLACPFNQKVGGKTK